MQKRHVNGSIEHANQHLKTTLCSQPALSGCGVIPASKPGHKDKIATLRERMGIYKKALPRSVGVKPGAGMAGVNLKCGHHLEYLDSIVPIVGNDDSTVTVHGHPEWLLKLAGLDLQNPAQQMRMAQRPKKQSRQEPVKARINCADGHSFSAFSPGQRNIGV